jgi:beta-glucanase (GH16 family)
VACGGSDKTIDDIKFKDNTPSWKLVFSDDFNYPNEELEEAWISHNGPSGNVHSSRWRENAVVKDGILHMNFKKETRGGQNWTAAHLWTKETFLYGKFECRYKYAAAVATNNSFWIFKNDMPNMFEIDINEGKYPNCIDTNTPEYPDPIKFDGYRLVAGIDSTNNFHTLTLNQPVLTTKIRLVSNQLAHFHIKEFRVFPFSSIYPDALDDNAQSGFSLPNYTKTAFVTVSGSYDSSDNRKPANAFDGKVATSWVTQQNNQKWIQLEWTQEKSISCVQFVNGWISNNTWRDLLTEFTVEYWQNGSWKRIGGINEKQLDLSADFHIYGFEWNKDWLIWYFDGEEIRRKANTVWHTAGRVYLSGAVIGYSGDITDKIDGTSMDVDWVKVYAWK